MKYTVHANGDGLLEPQRTLRAERDTRDEAKAEAVRLIREEGCTRTEVRCQRRLLDQYVRRGGSPRHIYAFVQRAVAPRARAEQPSMQFVGDGDG